MSWTANRISGVKLKLNWFYSANDPHSHCFNVVMLAVFIIYMVYLI